MWGMWLRVDVLSIGSYWLQLRINEACDQLVGVTRCIHSADDVLKILVEGDDSEVESRLLVHFQYDNLQHLCKSYLFSFVKFLLSNRLKIVQCTILDQASDAKKYKKIEEKMMGLGPKMVAVVHRLHAARVNPQERKYNLVKRIREEAYRLKEEREKGRTGLSFEG